MHDVLHERDKQMRLWIASSSAKVYRLADLESFVKYNIALPDHITDPLHKPSALTP